MACAGLRSGSGSIVAAAAFGWQACSDAWLDKLLCAADRAVGRPPCTPGGPAPPFANASSATKPRVQMTVRFKFVTGGPA